MEKLVCKNANKSVVNFILENVESINFNAVQKSLRKKDIKINGTRIKTDQPININDVVEVYYEKNTKKVEIIFENADFLVVNKPAGIETVAENAKSLQNDLNLQLNMQIFAVHRLDRNTKGLVMFAKTQNCKNILEKAFKNHLINKHYLAVVVGRPSIEKQRLVAYHKKDAEKSLCYISDSVKPGYSKIVTSYKVLKTNDILSLLEVEIETGKTHQIRAHLAHIGYPVLGDEKYGNKNINKQYKTKQQALMAYKLVANKEVFGKQITIELPNAKQQMSELL